MRKLVVSGLLLVVILGFAIGILGETQPAVRAIGGGLCPPSWCKVGYVSPYTAGILTVRVTNKSFVAHVYQTYGKIDGGDYIISEQKLIQPGQEEVFSIGPGIGGQVWATAGVGVHFDETQCPEGALTSFMVLIEDWNGNLLWAGGKTNVYTSRCYNWSPIWWY